MNNNTHGVQHRNNALSVAPSLDEVVEMDVPSERASFDKRALYVSAACMLLATFAVFIAQALQALIALCTNISFFGRWSILPTSPADNSLGLFVLVVPVIGGLVVGVMARYGSSGIRGHGIPEAMENVLVNESRIHPLLLFLKPISTAIAIGSGGPFG